MRRSFERADRTQRAHEDVVHEIVDVAPRHMRHPNAVDVRRGTHVEARERRAVALLHARNPRRFFRSARGNRATWMGTRSIAASFGSGIQSHASAALGGRSSRDIGARIGFVCGRTRVHACREVRHRAPREPLDVRAAQCTFLICCEHAFGSTHATNFARSIFAHVFRAWALPRAPTPLPSAPATR